MSPEEQAVLINEGLNALTEQLKRVNQVLEQLVETLAERQAAREADVRLADAKYERWLRSLLR